MDYKIITYTVFDKEMEEIFDYDLLEKKEFEKAVNRYEIKPVLGNWQVFDKVKNNYVGYSHKTNDLCKDELELYIKRSVYTEFEDYIVSGEWRINRGSGNRLSML